VAYWQRIALKAETLGSRRNDHRILTSPSFHKIINGPSKRAKVYSAIEEVILIKAHAPE